MVTIAGQRLYIKKSAIFGVLFVAHFNTVIPPTTIADANGYVHTKRDSIDKGARWEAPEVVRIPFFLYNDDTGRGRRFSASTAVAEVFGHKFKYDFSVATNQRRLVRLTGYVSGTNIAGSKLFVQYSIDDISWFPLGASGDTPYLPLDAAGVFAGDWVLVDTASQADVYVSIFTVDGDGANVSMENCYLDIKH